ncbi:FAD-dependent oxidoreductase [Frankia sp. Cpl3]|uniref:NAD(P)/FAD-dependent oxidoreductase n=1 Tax=Parafrankia colletiae TaxID=573497 RepID=UPI000AE877CC|nr:FAD-dependent oxidoreductase [Parafrankia colletiae]MCK9901037.1 FAD-dependent oxidoreductase [Frankia sp. Cpl3]
MVRSVPGTLSRPTVTVREQPPRVVVVGGGFAGVRLLRRLESLVPAGRAELVVVSPVDHLLYTSLVPQVCASSVEPRHLAVALRSVLRRTLLCLGDAVAVDLAARTVTTRTVDGSARTIAWDRLVLAPGSVTATPEVPGLAEHALGLKTLDEAVTLRDHVLAQLELADATEDPEQRSALCTFVVVGGGYTGTELAAQMAAFTRRAAAACQRVRPGDVRWVLVDHAPRLLHELAPALGRRAARVLARRGIDVHLGTSAMEISADSVVLAAGGPNVRRHTRVPTRTVVWCAGVAPSPLAAVLGLPTARGRLVTDEFFRVPSADGVFALGDVAAVPDSTHGGTPAGQTAQHAVRQGAAAARNVAASLGIGSARPYRHRDLGFVVDLGGRDAVANPLGVTLSGLPAAVVTRAYHLASLPSAANRARVATDWLLNDLFGQEITHYAAPGLAGRTIAASENTQIYDRRT